MNSARSTGVSDGADPFGLRSLDIEQLRTRPGTKWHRRPGVLPAWVADMDFPVSPAIRERLAHLASTDVGYPDWEHSAHSPLPEMFIERMSDRYGWVPRRERVHELCDVIQGVRVAVHHLTEPGDGVVVHVPAYPPFLETIQAMGRRLVPVPWPFDHDALADRLDAEPARMLLLCHPHNPTGHVFGRGELEHLATLVERHDLAVVSDEVHADLTYDPHRHLPFEVLGDGISSRTVTVTSSSKAFNLAGLRWAVLHAGHDRMQEVMGAVPDQYFGAPNVMAVAATEEAWSKSGAWLEAVRAVLDENRFLLAELLAEHLPEVSYRVPDATYLAWLDFRAAGFGDDPAEELLRNGVELAHGPRFGEHGRGFARLNFATSPDVLRRIVARMAAPHQV